MKDRKQQAMQQQAAKKNTAPAGTATALSRLAFMAGAIALATFLCFSPALKNGFINWDDNAYVFENASLNKPLPQAIQHFFGPHYFIGNYIPLTMTVYALSYKAAGLDPHFYHLVNVLLHLINTVLVFWLIYRLSGKKLLVAAVTALFFGIHPMHVESVAWIAELKDVLYSLFFISGLIAYLYYLESGNTGAKPQRRLLVFTFLFFTLSVLSKPAAIIFPAVLLLFDFYTGRKNSKQLWLEKLPFIITSVVFGIVAIRSQQADSLLHNDHGLPQRLLFAAHSLITYLVKLALPFNLSIFYPYPLPVNGMLPIAYYLGPLAVIALGYGVYRSLKHSRLIAFGFLFFLANIVLVLQLVSVGDAIMSERYTYIPYIGLFFIIAMWLDRLVNNPKQKPVAITALVLLAACSAYATHARCRIWQNDDTIATDLLNKFPDDRLALNNKGFILFEQGRFAEAIPLFTKAVQLKTDYAMAYINLINAYHRMNDLDNALKTADLALSHVPGDYNLLSKKGYILFAQHQYAEAIQLYNRAIALKKDNLNGYIYLSECYYVMQDYDNALKTLDTGLQYEPDNYMLLNSKGYILFVKGRYAEAAELFKASLKSRPGYTTAAVNLEDCLRAMNGGEKMR